MTIGNPGPTATLIERFGRRIRLGMVGGGLDSVIGETHRVAIRVDGMCELVAGAMSIDPEIAQATGRGDLLDPERVHVDYRTMAQAEAARADGIDAVVIATPPHTHLPVAVEFLSRGIDVICEKPLVKDLAEADQLVEAVRDSGRILVLTHCYTGYPMVREARAIVRSGRLGTVRMVDAQFASGDRGVAREPADPALRHWRFRPEVMGQSAILGEVGSHAHNIVEYVTGLTVTEVSAQMSTIAARRDVYDNAYLNVRFDSGALGRIWSSYVAIGNEHGLTFQIIGDDATLSWTQEQPEYLRVAPLDEPAYYITRGTHGTSSAAMLSTRFRPGHPEGYALAFANIYRDYATARIERDLGNADAAETALQRLPSVTDGRHVMSLIAGADASSAADGAWTKLD
jgi:predicted dehydrogenase